MKNNSTPIFWLKRIPPFIGCFIISLSVFCQPDYDFRNSALVSGTALQINAVYLFQNVKSGVDASITIKDITGGIVLSNIDGASGYVEAFQPILQVPPNSSGYVEFQIDFFIAGTSTPMIQTEIPATPIDVDGQTYGDGTVKEFDILQLTNGYVDYDLLGGELLMNISNPWVTGVNTAGVDYPGVDTTPRQVMFTTVNAGLSSFTLRTGATSWASGWHQRLRSIYFKKFAYPNSFLAVPSLVSFNGVSDSKKIILQWKTLSSNEIKKAVVERSYTSTAFVPVGEIQMNTGYSNNNTYNFTDNSYLPGTIYYRLKMTSTDGQASYSNILLFRQTGSSQHQSFTMYPSVIHDNATVNITSDKSDQASLLVFDLSGHMVYQKKMPLQQGNNNIAVSGFSSLHAGTYVATVKTANTSFNQRIIIQ